EASKWTVIPSGMSTLAPAVGTPLSQELGSDQLPWSWTKVWVTASSWTRASIAACSASCAPSSTTRASSCSQHSLVLAAPARARPPRLAKRPRRRYILPKDPMDLTTGDRMPMRDSLLQGLQRATPRGRCLAEERGDLRSMASGLAPSIRHDPYVMQGKNGQELVKRPSCVGPGRG